MCWHCSLVHIIIIGCLRLLQIQYYITLLTNFNGSRRSETECMQRLTVPNYSKTDRDYEYVKNKPTHNGHGTILPVKVRTRYWTCCFYFYFFISSKNSFVIRVATALESHRRSGRTQPSADRKRTAARTITTRRGLCPSGFSPIASRAPITVMTIAV